MQHSDVTISVVTHSAVEQSKKTVSAVLETREGASLVLTANGCPEIAEHFQQVARQREWVRVAVNPTNQGFIAPNNDAFDRCTTDFFVLLNDDAIPAPDWLCRMKDAMRDVSVAVAGPGDRWLNHSFVGQRWRGGFPVQPDFIEGSCMMVRVEALKSRREPLFWPELKIAYCEDADMCLRVRKHGLKLAITPFELIHRAGTTTRTVPELHDAIRKNFALCMKRWGHYLSTGQL